MFPVWRPYPGETQDSGAVGATASGLRFSSVDYAAPFVLKCLARVYTKKNIPLLGGPFRCSWRVEDPCRKESSPCTHEEYPDYYRGELLVACTALCAARSQQLQDLMSSCEAWEPVSRCIDSTTLRRSDFRVPLQHSQDSLREHSAGLKGVCPNKKQSWTF